MTEQDYIAEHEQGEHADFVDMDCPTCVGEWQEITR